MKIKGFLSQKRGSQRDEPPDKVIVIKGNKSVFWVGVIRIESGRKGGGGEFGREEVAGRERREKHRGLAGQVWARLGPNHFIISLYRFTTTEGFDISFSYFFFILKLNFSLSLLRNGSGGSLLFPFILSLSLSLSPSDIFSSSKWYPLSLFYRRSERKRNVFPLFIK